MKGHLIGYIRVSSPDQNPERQLDGMQLDKKFIDKLSGKNTERPALKELLDYAREGDSIIVHSLDRLGRNLDDLRSLVEKITSKGIKIQFIKENLIFTNEEQNPMSKLLLSVMGAFAEFERALIRERQVEGIAIAKKKGLYKGRKKALTHAQIEELRARAETRESRTKLANEFGIARATLYNYLSNI